MNYVDVSKEDVDSVQRYFCGPQFNSERETNLHDETRILIALNNAGVEGMCVTGLSYVVAPEVIFRMGRQVNQANASKMNVSLIEFPETQLTFGNSSTTKPTKWAIDERESIYGFVDRFRLYLSTPGITLLERMLKAIRNAEK
jgi:hypothetical protein